MKITTVLSTLALTAGLILSGTGTAHAAPKEATVKSVRVVADFAGNVTRDTRLCLRDYVNGGRLCSNVRHYNRGPVTVEGKHGRLYAECEFRRVVRYIGWSPKNLANGKHYLSMPSAIRDDRFHIYKITKERVAYTKQGCAPAYANQ